MVLTYLKEKIIKNILPIRPGRHYERRFTRYRLPKFSSNTREHLLNSMTLPSQGGDKMGGKNLPKKRSFYTVIL